MADEWDIVVWRRADDLRRQAERIQRNFFQMAVATRYRIQQGRNARWERPVPECCRDGELKIWEIPLGQFERRLAVIDGKKPLAVGEVKLRDGLLLIELRKNSCAPKKETPRRT